MMKNNFTLTKENSIKIPEGKHVYNVTYYSLKCLHVFMRTSVF